MATKLEQLELPGMVSASSPPVSSGGDAPEVPSRSSHAEHASVRLAEAMAVDTKRIGALAASWGSNYPDGPPHDKLVDFVGQHVSVESQQALYDLIASQIEDAK